MIRILIADDHVLVRRGLCMLLENEPDITLVGEASDGAAALELARSLRPTLVLADISMPPPDGIELARHLKVELPDTKTIIVSMHSDPVLVRSALAAGAAGYVTKHAAAFELVETIRKVAAGH